MTVLIRVDYYTLFLAVNKATQSLVRHSNTESADIMLDRLCESVAMSDVTLSRVLTLCGVWAGPDRCRLTCDSLERCVSVLMRVCKETWTETTGLVLLYGPVPCVGSS